MSVRQTLSKERSVYPPMLVSNTCSLLSTIVSELAATATGMEVKSIGILYKSCYVIVEKRNDEKMDKISGLGGGGVIWVLFSHMGIFVAYKAWWHIGITLSGICLSIGPSVCLSGSHTFMVVMLFFVTHSYVSQATHAFLECFHYLL